MLVLPLVHRSKGWSSWHLYWSCDPAIYSMHFMRKPASFYYIEQLRAMHEQTVDYVGKQVDDMWSANLPLEGESWTLRQNKVPAMPPMIFLQNQILNLSRKRKVYAVTRHMTRHASGGPVPQTAPGIAQRQFKINSPSNCNESVGFEANTPAKQTLLMTLQSGQCMRPLYCWMGFKRDCGRVRINDISCSACQTKQMKVAQLLSRSWEWISWHRISSAMGTPVVSGGKTGWSNICKVCKLP